MDLLTLVKYVVATSFLVSYFILGARLSLSSIIWDHKRDLEELARNSGQNRVDKAALLLFYLVCYLFWPLSYLKGSNLSRFH